MNKYAILTADIEIRAFQPTCRIDNHWEAQQAKFNFLNELQAKYECPFFDAGDLFDKKYKTHPSHDLLVWAIRNIPQPFFTIPGNHDLPGKAIENYSNSAMCVLEEAGVLNKVGQIHYGNFTILGFPWGVKLELSKRQKLSIERAKERGRKTIALVHEMVYLKEPPFPGCTGYSAQQVIDCLPGFDLIVTGHNHQSFLLESNEQLLVNPGSLMRNDADQDEYEPRVFLWDSEKNSVKPIPVPINKNVVTREHIDEVKQRENRLDAFITRLNNGLSHSINFHDNLEAAVNNNDLTKQVVDKIWQYYEKGA